MSRCTKTSTSISDKDLCVLYRVQLLRNGILPYEDNIQKLLPVSYLVKGNEKNASVILGKYKLLLSSIKEKDTSFDVSSFNATVNVANKIIDEIVRLIDQCNFEISMKAASMNKLASKFDITERTFFK